MLEGAYIGDDCKICEYVFVENDVALDDRVALKCGVHLWDGLRVQDDVFIGLNLIFTNDFCPCSKHYPEAYLQTRLHAGTSNRGVGAAMILPGLIFGQQAMVGIGSLVHQLVSARVDVGGKPAWLICFIAEDGDARSF